MKQEIKDEIMEELSNLPRIEMQGHSASGGKGDENQYHGNIFLFQNFILRNHRLSLKIIV